ncbi:MAG TPA: hypothetical protein VLF59_02125 [Candidatus Saccharimonadales bacterium]|nr:hypothetical protein [Candidatus Saccharimonadales bacterium]
MTWVQACVVSFYKYYIVMASSELTLPPNIDDLLRIGLSPFREPKGSATPLYDLDDHPDLLVRQEDGVFLDELRLGLESIYKAVTYGVNVLPSKLVTVDGSRYVVTAKVNGEPLQKLLSEPNERLLGQIDNQYANLGHYLIGAMNKAESACDDIYGPHQYMYGTILDDPQPKVWLVDLPNGAHDLGEANPYRGEIYNGRVMNWVNGIIEAESIADTTLHTARLVTEHAFALSSSTHRGSEWVAAFRDALEQRHELDSDEPPIADLRTF